MFLLALRYRRTEELTIIDDLLLDVLLLDLCVLIALYDVLLALGIIRL